MKFSLKGLLKDFNLTQKLPTSEEQILYKVMREYSAEQTRLQRKYRSGNGGYDYGAEWGSNAIKLLPIEPAKCKDSIEKTVSRLIEKESQKDFYAYIRQPSLQKEEKENIQWLSAHISELRDSMQKARHGMTKKYGYSRRSARLVPQN